MTTDILYVTYAKDHEWFRHSLQVLKKNLSGYRHIHVVTPTQDADAIRDIDGIRIHPVDDWTGRGYFWQQWVKLNADKYTDAEWITFIDSDVFIAAPTHIDDYTHDGKPVWMWAWYSDLSSDVPWRDPTEKAIGVTVHREYMQAFPFIIHRDTLALARQTIEAVVGDHEAYIKTAEKFSEFNVVGAVAHEHHADRYHFIDRNRDEGFKLSNDHWPKGVYNTRHFWSHAPLKDHLPVIHSFLTGKTPRGVKWTNMGICVIEHDTHISKWIEQVGRLDFDQHFIPKVTKHLSPGDVVVDVGAYIGDHTHAYAVAVRGVDGGRVLAFEPNAMPFYALTCNMQGHGHVECINKGLGEVEGTASIHHDNNVGASHLTQGGDIPITTLDAYNLDRCRLIKIDAEGYELSILKGAQATITRCRPVLVIEMNRGALARQGVTYDDIAGFLLANKYTLAEMVGSEEQHDIICMP